LSSRAREAPGPAPARGEIAFEITQPTQDVTGLSPVQRDHLISLLIDAVDVRLINAVTGELHINPDLGLPATISEWRPPGLAQWRLAGRL
jgi:hypothetical protein